MNRRPVRQSPLDVNAARLRELHDAVHDTVRTRNESDEARTRWSEACRRFHDEYDALAFPGGLTDGLERLRAHDERAIETAIHFLEVDPFFFRSGYIKAELLRRLKRALLTTSQQERLRNVILARIAGSDRREMRDYCRLGAALATSAFRQELEAMTASGDVRTARHARWALAALGSSPSDT